MTLPQPGPAETNRTGPARPSVSAAALADLLGRYDIGEVRAVEPQAQGAANLNLRVRTDRGDYLFRLYAAGRTAEEVAFELSILARLAEIGFPAQRVVRARSGAMQQRWQGSQVVLLSFLPGRTARQADHSPELSEQVGRLLGRLHHALAGFRPVGRKAAVELSELQQRLVGAAALLEEHRRAALATWLRESWLSATSGVSLEGLPRGVVHADVFDENVILDDCGQVAGLIDFDDAFTGTLLHDVAIAAFEFGWGPAQTLGPASVAAVCRGYRAEQGGLPKADLIVRAIWLNCYRFIRYSLARTLAAGEPPEADPYLQRLQYLADHDRRAALAREIQVA